MKENEMVGWHHKINGYEFKQTPADSEGQVHPPCCSPWGRKESDTTVSEQQQSALAIRNNQL